jgi:hypothetical protein
MSYFSDNRDNNKPDHAGDPGAGKTAKDIGFDYRAPSDRYRDDSRSSHEINTGWSDRLRERISDISAQVEHTEKELEAWFEGIASSLERNVSNLVSGQSTFSVSSNTMSPITQQRIAATTSFGFAMVGLFTLPVSAPAASVYYGLELIGIGLASGGASVNLAVSWFAPTDTALAWSASGYQNIFNPASLVTFDASIMLGIPTSESLKNAQAAGYVEKIATGSIGVFKEKSSIKNYGQIVYGISKTVENINTRKKNAR